MTSTVLKKVIWIIVLAIIIAMVLAPTVLGSVIDPNKYNPDSTQADSKVIEIAGIIVGIVRVVRNYSFSWSSYDYRNKIHVRKCRRKSTI